MVNIALKASDDVRPHRFAVAPMMDCTDRHYRYLARLLSRRALLYTEMLTSAAVLFGDPGKLLDFDPAEQPLVLQLGGSDPLQMARCARLAERWGYAQININVGCPSDRVQAGAFGACLMKRPALVANCVRAMRDATGLPVTVKQRIGVDEQDPREALPRFVEQVAEAGCETFIVHARKAWLKGLSPKQNRDVPPLDYGVVHQLKRSFPELTIVINGGFAGLDAARAQLASVDGVMLGRAAYADPYLLAGVDAGLFGDRREPPGRMQVLAAYAAYCERQLGRGVPLAQLTRPLCGLFQGCPGARAWRRHLGEAARQPGAGLEIIDAAAGRVEAAAA